MEMTKISDRVDILESESNDGMEETKSVGAVSIEFTGKLMFRLRLSFLKWPFSGLSDLIQSRRYGDSRQSNDNSGQEINKKLTKEDFYFAAIELSFNQNLIFV